MIMTVRCISFYITMHIYSIKNDEQYTKKYRTDEWRREGVHFAEERCLEADWPPLDGRCWFRRPPRQKIR